jgi:hypothetical protein
MTMGMRMGNLMAQRRQAMGMPTQAPTAGIAMPTQPNAPMMGAPQTSAPAPGMMPPQQPPMTMADAIRIRRQRMGMSGQPMPTTGIAMPTQPTVMQPPPRY